MSFDYEFNEGDYTGCVISIIKYYEKFFKENLEKALIPFMDEIRKKPLRINITIGEI